MSAETADETALTTAKAPANASSPSWWDSPRLHALRTSLTTFLAPQCSPEVAIKRRHTTNALLGITTLSTIAAVVFGKGIGQGFATFPLIVSLIGFGGIAIITPWKTLHRETVLVLAFLMIAVSVITPPRGSLDSMSYGAYGHMMSEYQASPYTHTPFDFPSDVWTQRVSPRWVDVGSVYGPVFTAVSSVGMAVAGDSLLLGRLLFQGLAGAAMVGILLVVDRRTKNPVALALLGLNPTLVAITVNGGHIDLWLGLAVVLATFAALDGKRDRATILLVVAALVKLTAGLAILGLLVWAYEQYGRRAAIRIAAIAGSGVGLAYLVMGGPTALRPLMDAGRNNFANSSFWSLPQRFFSGSLSSDVVSQPEARDLATALASRLSALTLILVAVAVVLARRHFVSPALPIGAAMLAFCFITPWLLPWYAAGALPVLALHWGSRLAKAGFAYVAVFSAAYARGYHPVGVMRSVLGALYWCMPFVHLAMICALIAVAYLRLRGKRPSWIPTSLLVNSQD